jgi:hypothetical protein
VFWWSIAVNKPQKETARYRVLELQNSLMNQSTVILSSTFNVFRKVLRLIVSQNVSFSFALLGCDSGHRFHCDSGQKVADTRFIPDYPKHYRNVKKPPGRQPLLGAITRLPNTEDATCFWYRSTMVLNAALFPFIQRQQLIIVSEISPS